ncbi:hypothetical protein LPJ53_001970 [Coemansia erecta]|uniref:Derlin n=1 Tax=Coemansia erecta TaxID=147472 RepID=A0A9W7XZ09_9FUNG|nr:hypothetical protein LPJ53_001970 [Coemansia erecta]
MVRSGSTQQRFRSDGSAIANWYSSLPPVTKQLLTCVVTCTLTVSMRMVPSHYMPLYWPWVWKGFQVWRLFTGFLTTHVSLNEAIMIVALYYYSSDLESQEFAGRTADYVWFILFSMISMASIAWITTTTLLYHGLFMSLLTMWSLHREQTIVNFFMGIKFPAQYLPYATMLLWFILKRGNLVAILGMIYGFGAAHLYYYLVVDLPSQGGVNYIPTPQLIYRIFGQPQRVSSRMASTGSATPGNTVHQRPGGGHFWGSSGRTLG